MTSLEREITFSKFNKYSRSIYAVDCSSGSRTHYLTKDSAYNKMENIQRQLQAVNCLEDIVLDDLDSRPTTLRTEAGTVYELLTLMIEY